MKTIWDFSKDESGSFTMDHYELQGDQLVLYDFPSEGTRVTVYNSAMFVFPMSYRPPRSSRSLNGDQQSSKSGSPEKRKGRSMVSRRLVSESSSGQTARWCPT